jgi:hypothetical protein
MVDGSRMSRNGLPLTSWEDFGTRSTRPPEIEVYGLNNAVRRLRLTGSVNR